MPHLRIRPISRILMGAGVLSACLPLHAQQVAAAAAAPDKTKLEEVVVTANKVATLPSKTPLALSVVTGDDLKENGIADVLSLEQIAPGLEIAVDSGRILIAIRGIVSTAADERGNPSASFNVDGLYIARFEAQGGAFMDLDRIEVLRGPQGTLYGRNSTAGAVNVITRKPGKAFEARIDAEIGNYGSRKLEGMINQPLNDRWSLRAAAQSFERDGYINPGQNTGTPMDSKSDYAGRVHLLGQLTKDTSLLLTAETFHQGGGNGTPVPNTNFFDGTPIQAGNYLQNPVFKDIGSSAQRTASLSFVGASKPAFTDNDHSNFRGELKSNLGFGELTYQLGYQTSDLSGRQNGRFNGFPFYAEGSGSGSALTNELRLNSVGQGPLTWVVGAYLFNEDVSRLTEFTTAIPNTSGFKLRFDGKVKNTASAIFGQSTYAIQPSTRLTTGLRYTSDKKSADYATNGVYSLPNGVVVPPSPFSNSKTYSATNWRIGLDHDLAPGTMVYAAVATGFKSGGFNVGTNGTEILPEHLRSVEAGVKTRLLSDRLQLSASVFDYSYDNIQVTSVITLPAGGTAAITTNAAKAKLRGGELEARMLVGDHGQLNASVALNDAKFNSYVFNNTINFTGQSLDRAPKTVVNLGYSHRFPLAGGSELVASFNTRSNSGYLLSVFDQNIRYRQPSYRKSDASLGWNSANGKISVQAFVKNIEDEITLETPVPAQFYTGDPRTYGIRTSFTF